MTTEIGRGQTGQLSEPVYQTWASSRRAFQWQGAQDHAQGFNRLEYPAVDSPGFRGRLAMLPAGQACATRSETGDAVFLGIEGELEVTVGNGIYSLKPLDLLSIPANTPYSYVNVELTNALVCGVFAKPDATDDARVGDGAAAAPIHMAWEIYRRDFRWTLPLAERWGYHRGSGPLITPSMLRGHTVRMPVAQSTPWHFAPRDMLFMGICHEVEFAAAGRGWLLRPFDFLIIPTGTPYTYTNVGLHEAIFFSIGGRLPPGKKGTYFSANPGWPIRPDAPTLDVEIDPYGDARVKQPPSQPPAAGVISTAPRSPES